MTRLRGESESERERREKHARPEKLARAEAVSAMALFLFVSKGPLWREFSQTRQDYVTNRGEDLSKNCVKVWREFRENKKLNFIYILTTFSFTRGLLSEGLEDTRLPSFFLLVIHSHTVTYTLGRGCTHVSARSTFSHCRTYDTNVLSV